LFVGVGGAKSQQSIRDTVIVFATVSMKSSTLCFWPVEEEEEQEDVGVGGVIAIVLWPVSGESL
jgi:hypothetical protein